MAKSFFRKLNYWLIYWSTYFFVKLLVFIYSPMTVRGLEHVPSAGGFILASNHLSYLDPPLLGYACGRHINYMARDSLFRNPVFGHIISTLGAFPIKRHSADKGALVEATRRLKAGAPVLMFPEGTRKVIQGAKKIEAGAGFLAVKTGVSVVPVFIEGSDRVLPMHAKFFKRAPVSICFGEPFSIPHETTYQEAAQEIMRRVYLLEKK